MLKWQAVPIDTPIERHVARFVEMPSVQDVAAVEKHKISGLCQITTGSD